MEQSQEASSHPQQSSLAGAEEENPACQSCRRRKLKCSREVPSCSQCSRLDATCVYNSRQKPGLKTGAVEALNRRVEALEELLRRDGEQLPPTQIDAQQSICHVSMLLVKELERIRKNPFSTSSSVSGLTQPSDTSESRKRKREYTTDESPSSYDSAEDSLLLSLPSPLILEEVIEVYFQRLHPWIPFLHQPRFKQQLENPSKKEDLAIILQAMVCATLRFIPQDQLRNEFTETERQTRKARQMVLLKSMERPSIVNLQALVIIAFDHLGSGEVEKAWSLIGSLTRTVDYLRLTVEPEEMMHHPLHKPLPLVSKSGSWTESEGRRRLFWNIFLLDRLCSVTTGWSTSLTSDDVHRKLPCDGGLWKREEKSDTPYFGIWNKSAARIGNSIAYIPAHYPTPDREGDHDNARSPAFVQTPGPVDTSKLGAFAYCIEATESLSQVTTFFLQQRVDFRNRQEVSGWLTRFKELDLRLVHWKMFLPQQWKDSNISRDSSLIDMDPNLTLAHVTHNTSMILLHQHIAFPPPDWMNLVKLPSPCSAETCYTAAIETVAITKKYLKYKPVDIVNSQFALCAFVAGRILLVHWRALNTELAPEYFEIVESLKQMSVRWQGSLPSGNGTNPNAPLHNLSGGYALKLEHIHSKLSETPLLYLNVLGYSKLRATAELEGLLPQLDESPDMMGHSSKSCLTSPLPSQASPQNTRHSTREHATSHTTIRNANEMSPTGPSPESHISTRHPHAMIRNNSHVGEFWQPLNSSNSSSSTFSHYGHIENVTEASGTYDRLPVDDELTAMSNILLGQQFMEMDRVITFDGTNFAIDMNQWQDMN